MRAIVALAWVACRQEEPAEELCYGTELLDRGDDGSIDREAALKLDSQHRTLSRSWIEGGFGLIDQRSVYDETGLIEITSFVDGREHSGTRWERRTDGQPLREERWAHEPGVPVGVTQFEYEDDKLSREIEGASVREHHRDEHGRLLGIDSWYDGELTAVVEFWYDEPAPSLDGGHRADNDLDGFFEVEMEQWFDGEQLIAEQGFSFGHRRESSWTYREDGQISSSWERYDEQISEEETAYDWRGLPVLQLDTLDHEGDGQLDGGGRVEWSWRCEAGAP